MLEWLLTAGNKKQKNGINIDPIAPVLDMSDPLGYFAALNELMSRSIKVKSKGKRSVDSAGQVVNKFPTPKRRTYSTPTDPAGDVIDTGGLGYGLIQEMQAIRKLNENAIVDKVTLSKGRSSGSPHETQIVFESEEAKKLYETNPQFKRKIDEIAKSMPGKTIYVKLDEYQHGRKITKAGDVMKKPPKKPDLWDELLKWLNKNKEEVAIILAIIVLLIAFVLR